jgi:adenine-specific DNA glycosylase
LKSIIACLPDLVLGLARQTEWPEAGYSPREIDRVFWHFGRAVSKATPNCANCPLTGICLTASAQLLKAP